MKAALDTNILAYAEGVNGPDRALDAQNLIDRLPVSALVISAQALGELFNVLVRKAGRTRQDAKTTITWWSEIYPVVDTSASILDMACDLAANHNFSIWDAVILCAAASNGCRLLISEDLHHGFNAHGVTIVNPFAADPHPLFRQFIEIHR